MVSLVDSFQHIKFPLDALLVYKIPLSVHLKCPLFELLSCLKLGPGTNLLCLISWNWKYMLVFWQWLPYKWFTDDVVILSASQQNLGIRHAVISRLQKCPELISDGYWAENIFGMRSVALASLSVLSTVFFPSVSGPDMRTCEVL